MAFDFQRYLEVCENDDSDFYRNLSPSLGPFWENDDDHLPTLTKKATTTSEESLTSSSMTSSADDDRFSPTSRLFDELREIPNPRRALDSITSRFEANQECAERGKVVLYKQTSLPASFGSCCFSKTRSDGGGRQRRNSVKFADEVGENLATFVMIPSRFEDDERDKETPDSAVPGNSSAPPVEAFTLRHQKQPETRQVDAGEPTKSSAETPMFQLCFDQPAADFDRFRRRLSRCSVCLENVKVDVRSQTDGTSNGFVNHGTVLCTIKVRNLHPDKRVFARCTGNGWRTHADVPAVYVADRMSGHGEHDTFAFALQNPFGYRGNGSREPEADGYCRKTAAVEFALCYEVLGSTYWDNNDGQNYRIVWM